MIRQAHHKRNQYITVRPEPVEGLDQSFLNESLSSCHFEHGEKSMLLLLKDSLLRSE